MAGFGVGWTEPAPIDFWRRIPELKSSADGFGTQSNTSSAFINELRFAASKSVRTSFLILASFNALAGATTALGIYWDCYRSSKRKNPDLELKSSFWRIIGPAEAFPFVLSLGIVAQGVIFAVAQSFGLQALLILGCQPISQVMLPAFFIVPYIQFIFGLEATFQALRLYHPFSSRYRWTIPLCLAATIIGLIGTYILTRFILPANFCFASLVFYLRRWGVGCFGITVGIAGTLAMGSAATFYRLYQVSGIGEQQRITATWMAWFMAMGALMLSITAPFFYVVSTDVLFDATNIQAQLSMAAAVVSNLTGIMTGGMYVLLRSSRIGKLGPKGYYEFDSQRSVRRPKASIPHSFIFTRQMEQPVPLPSQLPATRRRASSFYTTHEVELGAGTANAPIIDEPQQADGVPEPTSVGIATSTPAAVPSQGLQTRKGSAYNIFPRDTTTTIDPRSVYILPATAYLPSNEENAPNPFADELPPPSIIRFSGGGHNRDSSLGSSATVPIGLRVSNINDMPPVQSFYQVPPRPRAARPTRPVSKALVPPLLNSLEPPESQDASEGKDKQLPPVPLSLLNSSSEKNVDVEEVRLSPTVYSPKRNMNRGKGKADTPTAPPPGPRYSPENTSRVSEAEWI